MLPGDDDVDSMIDRRVGGNLLLRSVKMSKWFHLKQVIISMSAFFIPDSATKRN